VATFVGVLSMSVAADAQVARRIASVRPELVVLRPFTAAEDPFEHFDEEALDRVREEPGTVHAAIVDFYREASVRARWGTDGEQARSAPILAAEGDLIGATRALVDGGAFDGVDSRGRTHVALVGSGLANRLGLSDPRLGSTIWVDGVPFRVVGVVTDSEYMAALTDAVVIPRRTGIDVFGGGFQGGVAYVRVQRGMADVAAETLPLRLTPQAPERWAVEVPRVPLDVAEGISRDVRNLSLAVAALVMFIGVVAIGNAMMRSVYERMPEIGLRRALGAYGRHVLALLITESAIVGVVAGVLGVVAGVAASLAVGLRNDWPLAVSWWACVVAIPAGMAAGALGGLFPGIAAVRITPSQALRRE